jgi:hypothetical protein
MEDRNGVEHHCGERGETELRDHVHNAIITMLQQLDMHVLLFTTTDLLWHTA